MTDETAPAVPMLAPGSQTGSQTGSQPGSQTGIQTGRQDARSLAASLAPVIQEACDNRLDDVRWFKADWQRGGAATAIARYRHDHERFAPVVIKLPVGQRELTWCRRLQIDSGDDGVVGRLYASGDVLGGYDLAWIVIERFPVGPLGHHLADDTIPRICDAAARFHAAAARFPVDQGPRHEDWPALVADAAESIKVNPVEHQQQWSKALKALRARLDDLVAAWRARDTSQWLHGDLHLANAMCRAEGAQARVSLIDLAEVHAGHWVEDAIYLERQLWAIPERLKAHPPVRTLARARRELGLTADDDYQRLAMIRRALLAGTAPKFIRSEGHPRYLEACLARLETALAELK